MNLKDTLKSSFFFSSLEDYHLNELVKISEIRNYRKNELIFSEGEVADGFYIVKSGRVKIYKISYEGKEHILHLFGPGEPFGEVAAFTNKRFPANASTVEPSEVIFININRFKETLKKYPEISLGIISVLSQRLHNFTKIIENLSLKEVPARLAWYILYLCKDSDFAVLDMPKKSLANFLGTSAETLSRIFNKLKEKEIIEMKGNKIKVLKKDLLKDIAESILTLKEV